MSKKNYRKMSEKPEVDQTSVIESETLEAPVEESKIDETSRPEPVVGVVVGCGKLNIRKEPSASGEVLYEAVLKSELVIDIDKSTDDWFSVCTPAGIEGFCMKKFVETK